MYTFAAVPEAGFPGDIVLDPFCGTGATCLAAKSTGRRYIGIDLNPAYCSFARQRLELDDASSVDVSIPRVRLRSAKADAHQRQLFREPQ
jgi:DNA modification methylase